MNEEEYKTIRDEMLQGFRWTVELLFFAIASTGTLLSWLSTKRSEIPPNDLNPYLFIAVGLGIVGYIFYIYLTILKQVYNQGSYLAIFHERDNEDFRWHLLNRCYNKLIDKKSDGGSEEGRGVVALILFRIPNTIGKKLGWGSEGRRGAFALFLLLIANIMGPLCFLRENSWPIDREEGVALGLVIILGYWISTIIYNLWYTRDFMKENMKEWKKIKDKQEADPDLLEKTLENALSGG
ncbi:MAG: hypothetical protein KAU16_00705 [Methanophagales archaeon]|nr:hypothetical protein [Methanophagales archaeon]